VQCLEVVVGFTADNGASDFGNRRASAVRPREPLPVLLTVDEAATLLRTGSQRAPKTVNNVLTVLSTL
jgi:hypothetical protein